MFTSSLTHDGGFAANALRLLSSITPSTYADTTALAAAGLAYAAYALRAYTWDKPDPYRHIWYERPQMQDVASNRANHKTRNIAHRLDELGKDAVVFWGSQSGTAEGFANRLARELSQRLRLEAMAADLSDFDPETICTIPRTKTVIFILSTYGEGDPSDNASPFWDWLVKVQGQPLSALRYAAFGLGNSHYRYYNRVVDIVDKVLETCGATRLAPVGKADDAKGTTEEDFFSWKDELFRFFREQLHLQQHEIKYDPSLSAIEDDSLQLADLHLGEPVHLVDSRRRGGANTPIKALKIRHIFQMFSSPGRSCLHLELHLGSNSQLSYKTGDHLAVWPINPDQEVERLISVLGLSERRHIPICIATLDPAVKIKVPTPTTIETLFRYYLEICAAVPRDTVRGLAEFAPSPAAKEFLLHLSRDKDTYANFLAVTHVNIGRLLEMAFKAGEANAWSNVPLSYLIEALPRTQPRYYSISSSSIVSPRQPSITVAVADATLAGDTTTAIPGLATNYLQALAHSLEDPVPSRQLSSFTYNLSGPSQALHGGMVYAHIQRSKFKLPALSSCPLLMVAAGTGLAPFRGFIAQRLRLQSIGKPVGAMLLFFGCRRPEEDYIYRSELEGMAQELRGKLRIVAAFSRVEGPGRCYVQDKICELGSEVCNVLFDGASLYICGRASMAREVGKALGDAVGTEKGWDEARVKEWSESMKRNRKWQEDVWG